jgi:hypothetical protein
VDARRSIAFVAIAALGAVVGGLGIVAMFRPGVVVPVLGMAAFLVGLAAFMAGLFAAVSIRVVAVVASAIETAAAAKIAAGRPVKRTALDPRVARFAAIVAAVLVVLPVAGLGALISTCTFVGSADERAFAEQRFAAVRRRPRAFIDGAHDQLEKAAYAVVATSTDQRLNPFAGSSGQGSNPFRMDHTQSCIQGELTFRDGGSRDIAMLVVGNRNGERLAYGFEAITLDRRCSCVSHQKAGPEICTLAP